MDFYAVLDQVVELLRKRGRVSYRGLSEQFALDEARLEALKAELLYVHSGSVSDDGRGLVWTSSQRDPSEAERRQLTVLFCDLVDSTPLSGNPEDARTLLVPIYDWFGEGFDTRDLIEAKTLLDQLS